MPLWPLLATLGFLIVFITGVNIILNRGKLYGKGLITLLLVSVPVAVPSFIKIYFDLQISMAIHDCAKCCTESFFHHHGEKHCKRQVESTVACYTTLRDSSHRIYPVFAKENNAIWSRFRRLSHRYISHLELSATVP